MQALQLKLLLNGTERRACDNELFMYKCTPGTKSEGKKNVLRADKVATDNGAVIPEGRKTHSSIL